MGWTDTHLHQFTIRGKQYWVPDEGDMALRKKIDERNHRLTGRRLASDLAVYIRVRFRRPWTHELRVKTFLPRRQVSSIRICVEGAHACPPEDVGGTVGYENLLEAIHDPNHPQHEEYLEWIGDSFDPEAFDLDEVNRKLRQLK